VEYEGCGACTGAPSPPTGEGDPDEVPDADELGEADGADGAGDALPRDWLIDGCEGVETEPWLECPGSVLATAAERAAPARMAPAATKRVPRPIRSSPRSRDAVEFISFQSGRTQVRSDSTEG
jgi:hypothetical protein